MSSQEPRSVGPIPGEYEPPRVETVLTGDDLARQVSYAGEATADP